MDINSGKSWPYSKDFYNPQTIFKKFSKSNHTFKMEKTTNCIQFRYETKDKEIQQPLAVWFEQIKMETVQTL